MQVHRLARAGCGPGLLGRLLILLLLLPAPAPAMAEEDDAVSAVAIRLSAEASRTRFVADLTRTIGFKVYVLPDPYRVIIDMPEVDFQLPANSGSSGAGLVTGYRYGSLEQGRSRIVMDAGQPVLIERSFILHPKDGDPARLVVDLVGTDRETFVRLHRAEQLALDLAAESDEVPRELPPISIGPPRPAEPAAPAPAEPTIATRADPESEAEAEAEAEPEAVEVAARDRSGVPLPRPKPGSQRLAAADTVPVAAVPDEAPAAEPGKVRPVIVIDPGHGGIDPGAISKSGTTEKEVVLAFSKALHKALEATGRFDVRLTRDDDVFLSLRDRVRFAREHGADLFLAIHADSLSRGTARGATVYTLSDTATDSEAEALAQKENRSDVIAGVDLAAESEQISGILIDLAQRETKNHSVLFAKTLVSDLKSVARLNRRPIRSAGFRVLMAPDVPSVLFELGYLSNRSDESLLLSAEWRNKVAAGVAKAVQRYLGTQIASGE